MQDAPKVIFLEDELQFLIWKESFTNYACEVSVETVDRGDEPQERYKLVLYRYSSTEEQHVRYGLTKRKTLFRAIEGVKKYHLEVKTDKEFSKAERKERRKKKAEAKKKAAQAKTGTKFTITIGEIQAESSKDLANKIFPR